MTKQMKCRKLKLKKRKAPKRSVKTRAKKGHTKVTKPPELCSFFACGKKAAQIVRKNGAVVEAWCPEHVFTKEDIAFRERVDNLFWMIRTGVPALRKLAVMYPNKSVAAPPAMC